MMGETTGITWCDHTFNPWIGCSKVSEGCTNCYAERENRRYHWVDEWGINGERHKTGTANWKKPLAWNKAAELAGVRRKVFCGSLCDVFEDRPELVEWRQDLFDLIDVTESLDWLLLTKRPENIIEWYGITSYPDEIRENVWLGVTVENQDADKRLPYLADIPAKVKFVSYEPALGPLTLFGEKDGLSYNWLTDHPRGVHWVICGGESGPNARPMDLEWARDLRDQCHQADVPFFMKQINGTRKHMEDFPENLRIREFPRKETK